MLALLGVLLTDDAGLMLPDRASSDRSREAGLNDMTSQCTGVPAMGSCRTRRWHLTSLVVKGNQVFGSGRMVRFGAALSASEKARNSKSNKDEHWQ